MLVIITECQLNAGEKLYHSRTILTTHAYCLKLVRAVHASVGITPRCERGPCRATAGRRRARDRTSGPRPYSPWAPAWRRQLRWSDVMGRVGAVELAKHLRAGHPSKYLAAFSGLHACAHHTHVTRTFARTQLQTRRSHRLQRIARVSTSHTHTRPHAQTANTHIRLDMAFAALLNLYTVDSSKP